VRLGRALLILSAASLLTMPLTEHLWTWDHSLQGGQDFESGALLLVMFLCLALVLAHQCKRCVDLLFAHWRELVIHPSESGLAGILLHRALAIFRTDPMTGPASGIGIMPLRS